MAGRVHQLCETKITSCDAGSYSRSQPDCLASSDRGMWSRVEKMLHGMPISGVKHGKRSLSGLMRRMAGAGAAGSGAAGAGAEGADAALEAPPVSGTIELPWEGGLAERQPPMALGERVEQPAPSWRISPSVR